MAEPAPRTRRAPLARVRRHLSLSRRCGAVVAAVALAVGVATLSSFGGSPASASQATSSPTCWRVDWPVAACPQRPLRNQWVRRDGSNLMLGNRVWRADGVNAYWLGLDDNISDGEGATYPSHQAVDQAMSAARHLGARLVRSTTLGVSVGGPRTLEPSLGQFNDAAFDAIDYAVASARRHGLRLMIPLTDEWHYYHGGKHTFTNWTGHPDIPGQTVSTSADQRAEEAAFYTDPTTIAAFHDYVTHLMNHVNPYTGIRLGDDPTIAIWETGNELWDAPPSWTEQTAAFIKTLAPNALVADGTDSTGVDIRDTAVDEPDVDIVDAHFYPQDWATAQAQAAYTVQQGKAYLIGEYPLTGQTTATWLHSIATDPDISGALAWTLLPWLPDGTPEQHGEAYTFHWPAATPTEAAWDGQLRRSAIALARNTVTPPA